ncbi:ABC transporter substrate-binding protein [Acidimangrovimonas sediminis]|uniref:ABC transporter substrate-binding protein n=1 Tax=Acidimangrovimonas sediminis TaxID=2056283 RepID=UPI000C7FEDBB|nr:ABC transporter substrate-binding protein [Acidimangrovimonas sediminis]
MLKSLVLTAALLGAAPAFASGFPVTVRSCDREVTFDAAPKRAVSNDVNLTEMMLVLGLRDHMVGYTGISGWKTLDPAYRDGITELPELSAKYPTKEVLLGADADFYFAGWNYGMRVGGAVTPATLKPYGIKVYELTESCVHIMKMPKASMADLYDDLLNLGRIFGVEERAEKLVAGYRKELAQFRAGLSPLKHPPRVFVYDSGEQKPFTAGAYAMPTALIEAAGGHNVMDDVQTSWTKVGWESVIAANPDVIVIINYGKVTAKQKEAFLEDNPALANIPAVKNRRFAVLQYAEATPGPRNIDAIKRLAAAFRD